MTHTKLIPLTTLIKDLLESHHADTYFGGLVEALETAGEQAHIDDLIFETADNLCPVYYYDLNKWIGEHVEEINDTAREYGIDSVNFDLYKLAQQAWVVTEEGAMREYVEDACLVVALKQLAKDMPKISEETFSELKIALEMPLLRPLGISWTPLKRSRKKRRNEKPPQISLRIDDRHSGKANIPPSALSFNLKQF